MFASHIYKNSGGVVSDPNFKNVSLLLHGDGTNGAQNNTFLDSSTNNFTITRNGTPTQGSFSPYGNSWSNYFDGVSSLISTKSSELNFGVGNLTIEGWVNPSTIALNQYYCIFSFGPPIQIYLRNSTVEVYFNDSDDGVSYIVYGLTGPLNSISANTWNHFAVERNGTTFTVYVNGIAGTPATGVTRSIFYSSASPRIGRYDATLYPYLGNISNLRIVKGTALYTSNFTPPTSPLTAVAGTSLLTCQSNRFIDNSSNNFTITADGTPSVQPNSPFNPTSEYSITANGGSGYFPGVNGNYLSVPSNAAFNFASGTFTVECFCMTTNASATQYIVGNYNSATTGWYVQTYLNKFIASFSGDGIDIQGTTTIIPNVWYHVAVSGSAGSYKLFVNGTQEGSTYTGATSLAGGNLGIGAYGDRSGFIGTSPISGYISNARIVNGRACYTSNFTPPTSPVTLTSNGGATPSTEPTEGQVALLCDFTNAGIFDNAAKNNLLTVGTARVSTAEKKFGTGSMLFNGSTDYLSTINKQNLSLGSGNFTIECWVYANSIGSFNGVFAQWPNNGGSVNNSFVLESVGSNMEFYWCAGSTLFGPATLGTITTGSWIHYAICRSGNTLYPFKNGILGTTVSITQTLNSPTSNITVGGLVGGSGYWNGYIDDLRITKGVARYTANFTPPTQAFPNL